MVQCAVFLKAGLGSAVVATIPRLPFVLFGRDLSVVLETLKRGDLDKGGKDGPRTIVLRLYEIFGGHASVSLQINLSKVVAAYEMNLLEDDAGAEVLALERTTGGEGEYQRSGRRCRSGLRSTSSKRRRLKLVLSKEV